MAGAESVGKTTTLKGATKKGSDTQEEKAKQEKKKREKREIEAAPGGFNRETKAPTMHRGLMNHPWMKLGP